MATDSREARKQRSQQARAARLTAERRRRTTKFVVVLLVAALLIGGSTAGIFVGVNNSNSTQAAADNATEITTEPSTPDTLAPEVPAGETITGATPCPAAYGSSARASTFEEAPATCIDPAKSYSATFETTKGNITVALDTAATPVAANNFVVLSRYHYYDGTVFMRSNTGIDILQGGAPSQTNADPGPGYTLTDEALPATYADGDLVYANSGPNSSAAQFFFGTGENVAQLPGDYVKFGKVSEGLDVLHSIMDLHQDTTEGSGEGRPSEAVIVNKITITEA